MLMDSFEVENFRSLKHLKLEKLARVNLLVGKNNSGKTSVLEGMYALANADQPGWYRNIDREMQEEKIDADFIFYSFDTRLSIQLTATYASEEKSAAPDSSDASLRLALKSLNRSTVKEDAITKGRRPMHNRRLHTEYSVAAEFFVLDNPVPISFEVNLRANSDDEDAITVFDKIPSEELAHILPEEIYLRTINRLIETSTNIFVTVAELQQIIINQEEEAIVEILRPLESRLESVAVVGDEIYFGLGGSFGKLMPLNLMGEGTQRLLAVVVTMARFSGGIVLIDEIDNGLHYSALRILWKGILQAARAYDVQIVATTHSAEALRHLTWVLNEEENASYRADVAAYTLIRADDDTVRSYRHDYEQLGYALERGVEIRN